MNKEISFTNAITKSGLLKKQNPGLLKVYQSRYYTFRDRGSALVWFKNEPKNHDQVPQGILETAVITKVYPDPSDSTVFYIDYPERLFKLKAKNEQDRTEWLESFTEIKNYLAEQKKQKDKNPNAKQQQPKKYKWDEVGQQLAKKVQIENEQNFIHDSQGVDMKPQRNLDFLKSTQIIINQQQLNDMNKALKDRILCGFFLKKSGKFQHSRVKWFFMITGYNLNDPKDKKYEKFQNVTADYVERNTIYYFRTHNSDHQAQPKRIRVKDITSVNTVITDPPYKLILKYSESDGGEKEYTLTSKFIGDVEKWGKAIQMIQQRSASDSKSKEEKIQEMFKTEPDICKLECLYHSPMNEKPQESTFIVKKSGVAILQRSNPSYVAASTIKILIGDIIKYQINEEEKNKFVVATAERQYILEMPEQGKCEEAMTAIRKAIDEKSNDKKKQSEKSEEPRGNQEQQDQAKTQQNYDYYSSAKPAAQQNSESEDEGGFLSQRVKQRALTSRNFHRYYNMQISTNENSKAKQQQGWWTRFVNMLCGSNSDPY